MISRRRRALRDKPTMTQCTDQHASRNFKWFRLRRQSHWSAAALMLTLQTTNQYNRMENKGEEACWKSKCSTAMTWVTSSFWTAVPCRSKVPPLLTNNKYRPSVATSLTQHKVAVAQSVNWAQEYQSKITSRSQGKTTSNNRQISIWWAPLQRIKEWSPQLTNEEIRVAKLIVKIDK